jgi:hypothetical protein
MLVKRLLTMVVVIMIGGLILIWAQGGAKEKSHTASAPAVSEGKEAKTLFVDISALGRKDHAANKITELHDKMAKEGFTVIGLTPYTENGDLEGFFVTYVK